MHADRLGRVLVEQGVITDDQWRQALTRQRMDSRPIGLIIAEMFSLEENKLWEACAAALARECPRVHLAHEPFDPACLGVITAHQAWDHLVLPLRQEKGELVCATTRETLAGAIGLLHRCCPTPFRFVLAPVHPVEQFIAERYAYEGVEIAE